MPKFTVTFGSMYFLTSLALSLTAASIRVLTRWRSSGSSVARNRSMRFVAGHLPSMGSTSRLGSRSPNSTDLLPT